MSKDDEYVITARREGSKLEFIKYRKDKTQNDKKFLLYKIIYNNRVKNYVVTDEKIEITPEKFRQDFKSIGRRKVLWHIPSIPLIEEIFEDKLGNRYVLWGWIVE